MMISQDLSFSAPVWIWNNGVQAASRHFVTVPVEIGKYIKDLQSGQPKRGWGSVKVGVRVGRISRETSIFPDKTTQSYLLPLKATIRKQLGIKDGDTIAVVLELV